MNDFNFWFTIAVVVSMLAALAFELMQTEIIIATALFLLLGCGVIKAGEAFSGFSNEGMLTVAFLFVVAGALEATGVFSLLTRFLMGEKRGKLKPTLGRLLLPMAGFSAFINNTPLVVMMVPALKEWCRRHNFPSSKLFLPMNYAVILGGTCTLIGTSTNLVVHGLLIEKGYPGFSFFEIGRVGVPITIVGILALTFFLHRFLPKRKEVLEELSESTREFVVETKVNSEYAHIGKSIEGAGLRHLRGLFLFQIEREGIVIAPVQPSEPIRLHDRLFFAGLPSTIIELQKNKGLDVVKDHAFDLKNYDSSELKTYEVVVSPSSPLVGRRVRESSFRSMYNAVILAIHRSGERIQSKIGDIELKTGDTLLVLSDKEFHTRWYHSKDFSLVSVSKEVRSKRKLQATLAVGISLAMVAVATTEIMPMVLAAGSAALLMILTGCVSSQEGFEGIDFKVLLSISCSFGIATALENAGVAQFLGEKIVALATPYGVVAIIAAVYFATVAITEIISNNAAAAMLFPIGLSVASQLHMDPMPFVYAVVIGASTGFATPIGYQTNLMIQGPGGYTFKDFVKVGIPMDFIVGAVAVAAIYVVFF
jgi:di/tricarboxylate transporter